MINSEGNKLSWKDIVKELKNNDSSSYVDDSLFEGRIGLFKEKIIIYLDYKNSKELKDKYLDFLEKILFKFFNKKYPIEIKPYDEEYEFIEKHKNFLKNKNLSNLYTCNQNIYIFKNLKSFIEDKNSKNNVCYLWGKPKIGKSHIIGAVLSLYKEIIDFLYIDTSDFIDKYYEYQRSNKSMKNIYEWFSSYELIIFDSFQLIKNKKNINEEFLYLFNYLKKAIFISSYNKYIFEGLSEKLSYNFSLVIKIDNPDQEDIKIIINNFIKNQNKNIKFSEEAIDFLINNIGTNIQLVIDKLLKILIFTGNPPYLTIIDKEELKKILKKTNFFKLEKELFSYESNKRVEYICKKLDFNVKDILSNTRKKDIVLKRNIVIYILKKKHSLTHKDIGKILNKNHSTISHSLKIIEDKLRDKHFKKYLDNFF